MGIKTVVNKDSIIAGLAFGVATLLFEEGVHRASNPGIVNAVYRSQAALTAIVSVFLLGSSLSLQEMIGIIITIVGASTIALAKDKKEGYEPYHLDIDLDSDRENNKTSKKKGSWLPYALVAGVMATVKDITGVLSVRGKRMSPSSFVFSQAFFGAIIVGLYQLYKFGSIMPHAYKGTDTAKMWTGIGAASIDNFIWCAVLIYLMNKASNPAFPKAIQMSGIVVTSVVSSFFFSNASLNKEQWIGVVAVVAGIITMYA
jgi:drug/metabolite transporter (DMT)-like permease